MPQKTWGVVRVCVFACDSQCAFPRVFEGYPCFCARASMFYVCVQLLLCVCVYGGGDVIWGEERREAWQFNTRCLKSVGLTGCHKTAWLMESLGMSSPAVLMNPKPKGLMKRAPFAKTVPRLDLP